MTNHWRDIKHADLILINGANPAEAHPVGFQWFVKAKLDPTKGPGSGGGAKIIHADPRYTRTSAMADMYLRIRTGTDRKSTRLNSSHQIISYAVLCLKKTIHIQ